MSSDADDEARATASQAPVVPPRIAPAASGALEASLATRVRSNDGYGGGVVRLESSTAGLLWEGVAGESAFGGPPMTAADAFEIASVTKTFTATCVLQLMEEGKLSLETTLAELLPRAITDRLLVVDRVDYGGKITVRQLLSHTSGLPDHWTDRPFLARRGVNAFVGDFMSDVGRLWNPVEIIPYVRALTPAGTPGARYHYSDAGYVLLGLIVERVVGIGLHRVMRDRLLAPLRMDATYFSYREEAPPSLVVSHRYERKVDLHGQRRQSADWASGGLVSTTRDLGRFMVALAGGKLFRSASTLRTMHSWLPTSQSGVEYGLGLFRVRLEADLGEVWGHDGHGNAFMYYWPERDLIWVGTLNQTKNDWWELVKAGGPVLSAREHRE